MINLLDYSLEDLSKWMENNGESKFRSKQIMSWIYKDVLEFDNMLNIPKELKSKLKDNFIIDLPKVLACKTSKYDETRKMLLEYSDGNIIECVVMKYKHGYSICVSTQVGCRMGCKFCASTLNGRIRDLSCGEILSEVIVAKRIIGERISNIVLMGSGEPLDNYDNVVKFITLASADYGLNIGQRHITLSTCGIVPNIYKLADENFSITLAISLHAFSDEKRRVIMPIANKYSIKEILDSCNNYINKTNRRVSFEYSLVKDVNDTSEDAKSLGKLLKGLLCHVNLIPVNAVVENDFKRPTEKSVKNFEKTLSGMGIEVTVRRELGSDIDAACGQLRRSYIEQNRTKQ